MELEMETFVARLMEMSSNVESALLFIYELSVEYMVR